MERSLWLVRHGQSAWNAEGRWQGLGDPPLSERGQAQAREAASRIAQAFAGREIVRLYSSRLQRALQTAAQIGPVLGLEPEPVEGLEELDVGSWTGLTRDQILARDPAELEAFEREDPDVRPGGGESRRELGLRVRRTLAELAARDRDGGLLCVVHLGVIRSLVPGAEPANAELVRASWDNTRST